MVKDRYKVIFPMLKAHFKSQDKSVDEIKKQWTILGYYLFLLRQRLEFVEFKLHEFFELFYVKVTNRECHPTDPKIVKIMKTYTDLLRIITDYINYITYYGNLLDENPRASISHRPEPRILDQLELTCEGIMEYGRSQEPSYYSPEFIVQTSSLGFPSEEFILRILWIACITVDIDFGKTVGPIYGCDIKDERELEAMSAFASSHMHDRYEIPFSNCYRYSRIVDHQLKSNPIPRKLIPI